MDVAKRARVLPLGPPDGEGPIAWLDRHVPAVDGQPFERETGEPEDVEDTGGGGQLVAPRGGD